jgi:hypothetical protein
VPGLHVGLAGELVGKHGKVVGHDQVELVPSPIDPVYRTTCPSPNPSFPARRHWQVKVHRLPGLKRETWATRHLYCFS